ncbi:hypothetical protein ACN9MZ_10730 [Pseudoduganella sp. S-14]|uniref:hypothetical protein n=1 Tax=Pseudoduganella sp. S-14 TaxID=3404065 RepID=UPI003CEBCAAD
MPKFRRTRVPARRAIHIALAALLAAALLTAVSAGLHHRIAHASQEAGRDVAPTHSCLAYDAATLAERLPATPLLLPQAQAPARPLAYAERASPGRRAAPPYLPRGPPANALP